MRFAFYEKVADFLTNKYVPKQNNFMAFFWVMPCHYFSVPIFCGPCRAKIFRAKILRAGPCHKSAGPRVRAVPRRPCNGLCSARPTIGSNAAEINGTICILHDLQLGGFHFLLLCVYNITKVWLWCICNDTSTWPQTGWIGPSGPPRKIGNTSIES